ncbi:MAG TPA: hypothetical protein VHO95_00455 [Candidatus Dormibacteraeota bacterium]|jgi:hypothetical protein|nr:hypothetical protein [Candidatus Dormibacteraeota bacterium]
MIGLNARKLVALDMVFHGRRFIVGEFGAGVLLCGGLGAFSLTSGMRALGVALLSIALNYVPLLIHALDLARDGSASEEVAAELADTRAVRGYAWRQLWILVPLAVVIQDLAQRSARGVGGGLARFLATTAPGTADSPDERACPHFTTRG